jgi:DNA polymerase III subunit chi
MTEESSSAENPGATPVGPLPRVDFYVTEDVSPRARLRTACRVVEKAYLAGQTVLVWHTEVEELREFDELLWTFSDGSFVPHEPLTAGGFDSAPVLLSAGTPPPGSVDVLVNLAADVPACASVAQRVAEFIDGDPDRRQAGRARFRAYKDRGLQPATHTLRSES